MTEEQERMAKEAIEKIKSAAEDLQKLEAYSMAAILFTIIGTFCSGEERLNRELVMLMEAHNTRALQFIENKQALNN